MRAGARCATLLVAILAALQSFQARASDGAGQPLRFDEVARSVEVHDPRIRQAIQRLRRAEGDTMTARGAFDPRIGGDGKILTGAYYDLRTGDVELRQPTTAWGSEIYVGYRVGLGLNDRWPTYMSDQTLSGGEVRAGVDLPVWRGGLIDEERAARARALRLQDAAGYSLSATGLSLEIAAARAYWTWVSTGLGRDVAKDLLVLAEERDAQLRRRFQAGSIAEFDVIDNERILLERRSLLVAADRAFEQASFVLSLFLRDTDGESIVPGAERVPHDVDFEHFEPLPEARVMDRVLQCHPELGQVRAELEAAEVNRELTRNQLAPELRAFFQYSRDLGGFTGTEFEITLPGNVFETGLVLSMPLLFRADRGRARAAKADVAVKQAELQFLEDQLRARTRDAASGVRAAQERVGLAAGVVKTASKLAEGERRRFEVGASNLVFVNLREQQAAEAQIRLIEATATAEIEKTRWEVTTEVQCRRPVGG